MRRLLASASGPLLLLACAIPAAAQEAVSGRAIDLVPVTRGLSSSVLDLSPSLLDLVFRVEDLGGGTQDLRVRESDTEIRIELAADVLFDFDKADLRPEAREALAEVAAIVREHPRGKVRVEGHTDGKGSEAYNLRLSERRARAVRDWLAREGGLTGTGFVVKGLGESRPAAPNSKPDGSDNSEGRQKNRRVEIVVAKG